MTERKGHPVCAGLAIAMALALAGGAAASELEGRPANRLARETSPYLLQHAHNPVDWYPWGPEAFARARAEGKPVFLSVGYSSCYWCHVMERECFEDEAIAKTLNDQFVCIKVDREERPDVDQVYLTALRAFGQGGWPMSMFLTPESKPFYGGTYYPPRDRDGMAGFPAILKAVATAWRDQRAEIEKDADRLTDRVRRVTAALDAQGRVPLARAMAARGLDGLREQFDPQDAGFGFDPDRPDRPKFPEPVNLVFLLDQQRRGGSSKGRGPLAMALETMDRMARGGLRDHLAGGYHRYSVDRAWRVPHFEKMLYDNAQLASAHLLAFEITGDARWRREAEATFAFVARSLTSPEGGFYSALDAEAEGKEGEPYVWTRDQVKRVLGDGDDFAAFARAYGLDGAPSFEGDRHVLTIPRPIPDDLEARLAPLRAKLLAAREARPQPRRDDKVLTAWNGLMIAAYADGARVLKDESCRRSAEKAADFLLARLTTPEGRLLRTYRDGRAKLPAYLEDYAFLAHGLLRLHAATGDQERLDQARRLADRMLADFADEEHGGFFYTADDHESLLARTKDPYDDALPSGNSVAVRVLLALARATGEARDRDAAGKALDAFSPALSRAPAGLPLMLVGLQEYLNDRPQGLETLGAGAERLPAPGGLVTARATRAGGSKVEPGREFAVTLDLAIREGWHIYANPVGQEALKPTAVTLAEGSPFVLVGVDYPAGTARPPGETRAGTARTYEGKVALTAHLRPDEGIAGGEATLVFMVRYQTCNDRVCLAPASLEVPLRVVIPAR